MGSIESGIPTRRDREPVHRSSSSRIDKHAILQKPRSKLSRFLLFKRLDYLQWICTVAVFLFFVVLFQMFLPGSVVEKSEERESGDEGMLRDLRGKLGLDVLEEFEIVPTKLMKKFRREFGGGFNRSFIGDRKPKLALVFADLLVDSQQLLMVTVASALREIGYDIEVCSLKAGPVHNVWRSIGIPVTINSGKMDIVVDWLNYDGIVVTSIEAKSVLSSLMQEPFKSIPLIWAIHERTLALRSRHYAESGEIELLNDWKKFFNRASVVVFPNYFLPMIYSMFDTGNYYVIPGSPANVWEVNNIIASNKDEIRLRMGYRPVDVVVAIVGTEFIYRGMWLDHALILEALLPLVRELSNDEDSSDSHLKVVVLSRDSASNYSKAVEGIAINLRYPEGVVKHVAADRDADSVLYVADLVIYGTFLEEHSFPDILMKSMLFAKPIIAPDLSMIKNHVDDRVNGYLYPKGNTRLLSDIISQVIENGEVSSVALRIASSGRDTAKNLMASETVEGYASLLVNVLKLPSEVAPPRPTLDIPPKLREEWQWGLFEVFFNVTYVDRTLPSDRFLNKVEEQWNHTQKVNSNHANHIDASFVYYFWGEQKNIDAAYAIKRREEDELKDRSDQPRGTWDEIYKNVKKAERLKNDLHERDEGELERTGQPLSIYEPYYGEGAWPFLHNTSLYRGIGLSTKGRRPGADDVDAPSRLPLLNNPYYRDTLGEYGAFFAMANRIDQVHKNAWIGFQAWRVTARRASLSKTAEKALLDAIQRQTHGDTLYFWVRMDKDPRNPLHKDFWSFCDAINAGNCRFAFSKALKRMYGMSPDFSSLPPMPIDGNTWSVMHSWALPTRSFLEFVMFSRMFVDALDAQMYDEHHQSGSCYLSLSKDKHCYARLLELLINVWAYHSARRMVYVNPETGVMQEHHRLKSRRGHMWIKWFTYTTLKSMDEDFAEEADSDHPTRRWLWPSTGEVVWEGVLEKEKNQQRMEKEKRKQLSREKLTRMRRRKRQKAIGKYVKPSPEDMEHSNSTVVRAKLLRLS